MDGHRKLGGGIEGKVPEVRELIPSFHRLCCLPGSGRGDTWTNGSCSDQLGWGPEGGPRGFPEKVASELSLQVGDRDLVEGTACAKTGPSRAGSAGPRAIPVAKSQMRDGQG